MHGRPLDCAGREAREVAVYDLLDSLISRCKEK